MKKFLIIIVASLMTLGLAFKANAVVIDFDSLSEWDLVSNQFAEATFSPDTGIELRAKTINGSFGTSSPNVLCAVPTSTAFGNCGNSPGGFTVDFTNPVNSLNFLFATNNVTNVVIGKVDVFENFAFSSTIDIIGTIFATGEIVDLTAFSNVTKIEIHSITDLGGIVYDNFSFSVSVPEPSTLLLLGSGLAGLIALRRKFSA